MARNARSLLVLAGLLAWVSIAFADVSEARKLPSDTFKRFMVNGTDFHVVSCEALVQEKCGK